MKTLTWVLFSFALICIGAVTTYGLINYWPYIFSRKVTGVLLSVDRVQVNVSLMQGSGEKLDPTLFSFAVAIREDTGEIVTASAEDRQWAAAQRGLCAEATYYPYPPWQVMKSGTYFNARLDRLFECPEKAASLPPIHIPGYPPTPESQNPPGNPPINQQPNQPPLPTPTPPPSKIPTH